MTPQVIDNLRKESSNQQVVKREKSDGCSDQTFDLDILYSVSVFNTLDVCGYAAHRIHTTHPPLPAIHLPSAIHVLLAIDVDLLPAIHLQPLPTIHQLLQAIHLRPGIHLQLHLLLGIRLRLLLGISLPPPARDLALAHHPTYACYPARHRCAWASPPFPLDCACEGGRVGLEVM
jgi:hypothetical protein